MTCAGLDMLALLRQSLGGFRAPPLEEQVEPQPTLCGREQQAPVGCPSVPLCPGPWGRGVFPDRTHALSGLSAGLLSAVIRKVPDIWRGDRSLGSGEVNPQAWVEALWHQRRYVCVCERERKCECAWVCLCESM